MNADGCGRVCEDCSHVDVMAEPATFLFSVSFRVVRGLFVLPAEHAELRGKSDVGRWSFDKKC